MIVALLLLLLFGGGVLYLAPRKMNLEASRTGLMTRFMEQDYVCCDLSYARSNKRCEEVLRGVAELARGGPNSPYTVPAANALANCPAAELMGLTGDPANVRQPIASLTRQLQDPNPEVRKKAVRLLVSDSTVSREVAQRVRRGGDAREQTELVNAVVALLVDEHESDTDRQKAAAMLDELGDTASSAVPTLVLALRSPKPGIRIAAAATLTGMGSKALTALPELTRLAYREPLPGVRQQMLVNLGKIDAKAACCYALFQEPTPQCAETLAIVARRQKVLAESSQTSEDCPAALIVSIAGNPAAVAHPMPFLEQALHAPDIATRRRAATTVGLIAGTLQWHSRVDRNAIAALHDGFRSGIPELVLDSAEALRQISDSSPSDGSLANPEMFLTVLRDEKSDRRAAAAWALGQVGRPALPAVPDLRKALDQDDEPLADAAYYSLNRIAVASGFERLGYKTNGKYPLKPDVMAALTKLSSGEPAAVAR